MAMDEPRVLLVYHTSEGQTAKVADRIAQVLRDGGAIVDVFSAEEAPGPVPYEAAVLGDSIHAQHHSKALLHWAGDHAANLNSKPSAYFQVSLTSASDTEEDQAAAQGFVADLVRRTGFDPDVVGMFAGALAYTKYGWIKRRMMRAIAKRQGGSTDTHTDHELTDWDAVDAFARDVLHHFQEACVPR